MAILGYVEASLAKENDVVKRSISTRNALVLVAVGLLVTTVAGCNAGSADADRVPAGPSERPSTTPSADSTAAAGRGMAAISEAGDAGKYLFLFCWKVDDEQTRAMRKIFDGAMVKAADRAQSVVVNINDAAEESVVAKYGLNRAPMPLVLALAPNGAITGGFPTRLDEQQLLDAFATPGTEKVMKSLQDGKLVFVCVQNDKTKSNNAAMQGVLAFQADVRFASATEIVTLDPADKKEARFLTDLKVPPDTAEATTVFVVPPGKAIGKFEGVTNKDALVELLGKANTSCGPGGCGPGGCGPR
jgi:hypothetical protein